MPEGSDHGLLLTLWAPSWLGRVMAALSRAVWAVPGLGFPCQLFLLCHPKPGLYSWHFHPCPAPLPFLATPSPPAQVGGVGLPFPATRREQSTNLAIWCFWGRTAAGEALLLQVRLCSCCRSLPWPLCVLPAPPQQPPRCCGWQSCVALAVLYLVFPYLAYPVAAVIRCIGNADVFITCRRCSFVGTLASNFQNFIGGGFLIPFVDFFSKLEIKLWFLIELLQTQCFLKLNFLGFKLMEQETANSDGLGELFQGADM